MQKDTIGHYNAIVSYDSRFDYYTEDANLFQSLVTKLIQLNFHIVLLSYNIISILTPIISRQ